MLHVKGTCLNICHQFKYWVFKYLVQLKFITH